MSLKSSHYLMPEKKRGAGWRPPATDQTASRDEGTSTPRPKQRTRFRTRLADALRSGVRWATLALFLAVALLPVAFAFVPVVTIGLALFLPILLPVLAGLLALSAGAGQPGEPTDRHAGGPVPPHPGLPAYKPCPSG